MKLCYSHAVCISVFCLSYHYSLPVNILLNYTLSLLSPQRFFFPAFTEQEVLMMRMILFCGSLNFNYSWFCYSWLQSSSKEEKNSTKCFGSPIRIPLKEILLQESKSFKHWPKTVAVEVSCHLPNPLGQAQANKRHFCEHPFPLLEISSSLLQRLMLSGFLPPDYFLTYQGILFSALWMLSGVDRLMWKDC